MRGLVVAFGLLSLLAGSSIEAQQQSVAPTASTEPFKRGRELLAAGRYLDAAEAFHECLRAEGLNKFTIQVAVYCDGSNVAAHLERSGSPPDLFLLRRPVRGQSCFGLFWGLFPSRSGADAAVASVPAALRTRGLGFVAVSSLLAPGELATARPPALPLPAPQVRVPAPTPAPVPVAPPEPEVTPAPPTMPRQAASVSPPPATAVPPPVEAPPVLAEPVRSAVPRAEIGLGYSYLWDDSMSGIQLTDGSVSLPLELSGSFKVGWVLSGNLNVTDNLGIVGEASGDYRTQDVLGSDLNVGASVLAFHAGLRYTDRDDAVATPYAQLLFGATRFSMDLLGEGQAETNFSIQPGVGVMFRVSDLIRIGMGGDYRRVFTKGGGFPLVFPEHNTNEFRLHAGIVFNAGNR